MVFVSRSCWTIVKHYSRFGMMPSLRRANMWTCISTMSRHGRICLLGVALLSRLLDQLSSQVGLQS
jgi:hypothetical protein